MLELHRYTVTGGILYFLFLFLFNTCRQFFTHYKQHTIVQKANVFRVKTKMFRNSATELQKVSHGACFQVMALRILNKITSYNRVIFTGLCDVLDYRGGSGVRDDYSRNT